MKQRRYNGSGLRAQGSGLRAQGSGLRGEWANFCRLTKGLSLLLLLLFLCGTASAELVYTVVSKDYSIGRVNYDAGGLPQNETVLKDIKASGLYFNEVFSTDQGEWRVLTRTSSSDSTFTLSLYDPDKDWKNPLAKAENLRGYIYYQDDSSLYLVSSDISSYTYTVTKVDKKTLAVTKESMKGYPQFEYLDEDGIIYSRNYNSEKPSLTVLDGDLKGTTFALDEGDYNGYNSLASLGGGSLALAFVSRDMEQGVDSEGNPSERVRINDLGIFKFTNSEKTPILTSADLGFSGAYENSWGVSALASDKRGGLYFRVDKNGSYIYHWDGLKFTSHEIDPGGASIYSWSLPIVYGSGNAYYTVNKGYEKTSTSTSSLWRWDGSQDKPVTVTDEFTVEFSDSLHQIVLWGEDDSGNVYFTVYKDTKDETTGISSYTSYALYRCGVSQSKATKLYEVKDGSAISLCWYSAYKDGKYQSSFCDDSGNVYFTVSKYTQDAQTYDTTYTSYALYRCGTSQTSAVKLYGVTDGSVINFAGMDDSNNVYFTVSKRARDAQTGDTTYTSSALYRCGTSQTTPDKIHEVKDGSYISVSDVSEAGSKGVYFAVVKEAVEKVEVGKEVEVAESEAGHYIIERYYYPSYAFCHYDGSDVTTIHTFSNVSFGSTGRQVDEKHKALYLYAVPFVSQDVAVSTTLLAFDNTDRHNPEKFSDYPVTIAGRIGNVALYNDTVSSVIPAEPTRSNTTPKSDVDLSKTPASGLTSFPFTVWSTDGTMVPGGTVFRIWITILSHLSVAANLADAEEQYYCEGLKSDEDGKLVINPSKMKLLDAKGNEVSEFPGGTCRISYESADGKHYGKYPDSVTLAKSSSSSSGGATSNKGSGGCDAGFGALALAVLAAGVLLKKHSK